MSDRITPPQPSVASLSGAFVQPGDDAADLGSGAAADGLVLTADGAGGAAWEAGGSGGLGFGLNDGTSNYWVLPGFGFYGGGGTLAHVADVAYFTPMVLQEPMTIGAVGLSVNATGTATAASLAIYEANSLYRPGNLVVDCGTVAVGSTGLKQATANTQLAAGRYVIRVNLNGTATLLCQLVPSPAQIPSWIANGVLKQMTASGVTYNATAPATGEAWSSAASSNNGFYPSALVTVTSIP